ncbi:MAG: efflux RND transporter periplasmic adaptor subunit [Deltaproteobacteria bacterium HGW-Deltaproteobacteria-21]|nr:MAG: efflux RND transporter periplasmic adaptor subunit [Deltaproteobacteria bacterium HGW-Deltaproteobacteria-21]
MKLQIMSNSLTAAVVLFVALTLLVSCDRVESPKEAKASATVDQRKDDHDDDEAEHSGDVVLSPEQMKAAGVEVKEVILTGFSPSLTATAVIEPNNDRMSRIGAKVAGRIAKVTAVLGDRVKAGQPLAYLESVELDQAWSEYAKSKGKRSLAAANLKREETLFEKKIAPEKDVLRARQELSEAEADLSLSAKRLRILGVEESKLGSPSDAGKNNHLLMVISSPIPGVVVEKTVTPGEMVSPEKVLFVVSDLSSLWVVIDVYEKDLGRLKAGMEVKLLIAAYPDTLFKGNISYVGDFMDQNTRTVKARVTIDNKDGFLKPGMFATVSMDSIKEPLAEKIIAVPEEAIFLDGAERYVFVGEGEGRFAPRRVSVGRVSGETIEIKEGLKAGDAVVAKGVFALKSELKKGTLEVHEH